MKAMSFWPRAGKILILTTSLSSLTLQAGFVGNMSLGLGVFSFRATDEGETPNYYGLIPELQMGYSIKQLVDITLFFDYTASHQGSPQFSRNDASLLYYGLALTTRLREAIVFRLKGGSMTYRLGVTTDALGEVKGRYEGTAGSIGLGAMFRLNRENFVEVGMELSHAQLLDDSKTRKKRLDRIALTLGYTFSDFVNSLVRGTLFDSMF